MLFFIDAYPKLQHAPYLTKPLVGKNDFHFLCIVPYPQSKNDAILEVTWFADGQPIKTPEILTGSQRESTLFGQELAGFMNKNITCAAVTRFADNHTGVSSPLLSSASYWAGIKVCNIHSSKQLISKTATAHICPVKLKQGPLINYSCNSYI